MSSLIKSLLALILTVGSLPPAAAISMSNDSEFVFSVKEVLFVVQQTSDSQIYLNKSAVELNLALTNSSGAPFSYRNLNFNLVSSDANAAAIITESFSQADRLSPAHFKIAFPATSTKGQYRLSVETAAGDEVGYVVIDKVSPGDGQLITLQNPKAFACVEFAGSTCLQYAGSRLLEESASLNLKLTDFLGGVLKNSQIEASCVSETRLNKTCRSVKYLSDNQGLIEYRYTHLGFQNETSRMESATFEFKGKFTETAVRIEFVRSLKLESLQVKASYLNDLGTPTSWKSVSEHNFLNKSLNIDNLDGTSQSALNDLLAIEVLPVNKDGVVLINKAISLDMPDSFISSRISANTSAMKRSSLKTRSAADGQIFYVTSLSAGQKFLLVQVDDKKVVLRQDFVVKSPEVARYLTPVVSKVVVAENEIKTIKYRAQDRFGNPIKNVDVEFKLLSVDGKDTLLEATKVKSDSNGLATFDLYGVNLIGHEELKLDAKLAGYEVFALSCSNQEIPTANSCAQSFLPLSSEPVFTSSVRILNQKNETNQNLVSVKIVGGSKKITITAANALNRVITVFVEGKLKSAYRDNGVSKVLPVAPGKKLITIRILSLNFKKSKTVTVKP